MSLLSQQENEEIVNRVSIFCIIQFLNNYFDSHKINEPRQYKDEMASFEFKLF